MIVYGVKSTSLIIAPVAELCPYCGKTGTLYMTVFQRYFHLFWLPFFPVGKTGVSQCTHCLQVLKLKQMPPSLRMRYENLKLPTSTPIWTFIGTGIMVLLAVIAPIIINNSAEDLNRKVASPQSR